MSSPNVVLTDKVSLEYLIGLAHQKTGAFINIADVDSVHVIKYLTGTKAMFQNEELAARNMD